jgi:hypothetical protein
MMDIASLLLLLTSGVLLIVGLYGLYRSVILFLYGWEVLVHVFIKKNGILGLSFLILMFIFAFPFAVFLTLFLGYREMKWEEKFDRILSTELEKRNRKE